MSTVWEANKRKPWDGVGISKRMLARKQGNAMIPFDSTSNRLTYLALYSRRSSTNHQNAHRPRTCSLFNWNFLLGQREKPTHSLLWVLCQDDCNDNAIMVAAKSCFLVWDFFPQISSCFFPVGQSGVNWPVRRLFCASFHQSFSLRAYPSYHYRLMINWRKHVIEPHKDVHGCVVRSNTIVLVIICCGCCCYLACKWKVGDSTNISCDDLISRD